RCDAMLLFDLTQRPPRATLFPYTTLFRSQPVQPGTGVEPRGAASGGERGPGVGGGYFTATGQHSQQPLRYSGGRSRTASPAAGAAGRSAACTCGAESELAGTAEQPYAGAADGRGWSDGAG